MWPSILPTPTRYPMGTTIAMYKAGIPITLSVMKDTIGVITDHN